MKYREMYAQHLRKVLSSEAWEEQDMEEVIDNFYFYELPRDFHKTNPKDMQCICEIHLDITQFCYEHIELDGFTKPVNRYIAFLESDKTYAWKNIRPLFHQSLVKILTLGVIDKFEESLKAQGNIDYWPFISQEEYLSVCCPVRTTDSSIFS